MASQAKKRSSAAPSLASTIARHCCACCSASAGSPACSQVIASRYSARSVSSQVPASAQYRRPAWAAVIISARSAAERPAFSSSVQATLLPATARARIVGSVAARPAWSASASASPNNALARAVSRSARLAAASAVTRMRSDALIAARSSALPSHRARLACKRINAAAAAPPGLQAGCAASKCSSARPSCQRPRCSPRTWCTRWASGGDLGLVGHEAGSLRGQARGHGGGVGGVIVPGLAEEAVEVHGTLLWPERLAGRAGP
jgi:hypothetical protein